jgi:L-seryl-tRNA(Ser) seleniumtransferase
VALSGTTDSSEAIAARLREGSPPVIGRVERESVLLDLRSIQPEEDVAVAAALSALPKVR